jgi:hypothetical protein
MLKRIVLGLLFAMLPGVALAQGQENFLPPKSQLYFRFDGMEKHQATYDKTAVGKMMQGETGKFLDEFWKYTQENLQTAAQNEPKIGPLLKDFNKLIVAMYQNGLVMGVAVDKVNPPAVQTVLVFPKAAGESGTLLPLVQKIAEETKAKVQSAKVGKRFVNTVDVQFLKIGWWAQGNDAIIFLGSTDPVAFAKDIDTKKTGLASHALYKRVAGFKEFPTVSRGYLDLNNLLTVASEIDPRAEKIIDHLGLKGIKSITFASGFDGPAERAVVDVDIPGTRTGLLALSSQKKISLKDLPKLPKDLDGFSAGTIAISKSYDVITKLVEGVLGVVAPDQVDNVKDQIKNFEGAVGIDFNKDLFDNFGDVYVSYNSGSDGFLGTGAVVAVQIKDGKKMAATIQKLIKAVPVIPGGGELAIKKTTYRSGEIFQLGMSGGQVNSHFASFGIYKGWFVYSQFPTAIKGFILRQEGEIPAWKADESTAKALAQFPSEFTAIHISDPRPTVKIALSIAPFVLNLANTGIPFVLPGYRSFDLELIPHPEEATRHLFPNVTVTTDDGKRQRTETRGSLLLPF